MTPADEHRLYLADKQAWAKYVAPNWVRMLKESNERERRELWAMARPELRVEIKRLARAETQAERGFQHHKSLTASQMRCVEGQP